MNEVAVVTTMSPQDILDNISTGIVALNADLAVTAINYRCAIDPELPRFDWPPALLPILSLKG